MKYKFIDSHAHVHFEAYKEDMHEVVQRSLDAGVGIVTIGTQSTTSKNGIALAEQYEGVWATIGLHPNHLHKQEFHDANELPKESTTSTSSAKPNDSTLSTVANGHVITRSEQFNPELYRKLAAHPKVIGVGEFGLDYYRLPPNIDKATMIADQKTACRAQLAFATEVNKPIVIHCRDAHADQALLIREEIESGGLAKRGVIHSFTGTAKEAAIYRELGFMVAFNGILTFSKDLQRELKEIPLEQIMIETDSPYLTPPPNRGKRNEPHYVKFIAEKIAEIKEISLDEVATITTQNTVKTFGLE